MSYIRFTLMIATSTVVMFLLMYLNTYAWTHVFFSETRTYMAIMMGATMAVVMLAYMLGMYANRSLNVAIFAGALIVFAAMLWLVRSQATVSGASYMRAMIPHHSIAVMTSERAQIRDARVRELADEIIDAQRREIAEMRYLLAEVSSGNVVETIYRDPPATAGSVQDALGKTLIARLHPEPLGRVEADLLLEAGDRCAFSRDGGETPILWTAPEGRSAAMKLNGVLISLDGSGDMDFAAEGASVSVRSLGEEGDWRADSELVFRLDQGLSVGYRGFWACPV